MDNIVPLLYLSILLLSLLLLSFFIGRQIIERKQIEDNLSVLQNKIRKNEDFEGISNLYNTIGFTYAQTEQYELAIYYYKEALKNDDNYTVALNNLGYAYEKEKMINEALGTYIKVIEIEKNNETALSRIQILKRRIPKSG